MKNINPTETISWKKLQIHFKNIKNVKIYDLFKNDKNRFNNFSYIFENQIIVDFSKNRITKYTIDKLIQLAKECNIKKEIRSMFDGKKINKTENRAVLHTALRNENNKPIYINNNNIMLKISSTLKKMKNFSEKIIQGYWTGYSGKKITDIVNVGIGGSDLGPSMVIESLKKYKNHLKMHFISNIDGTSIIETLKHLTSDTTLFIISSKTFTTEETIINAKSIKKWFLRNGGKEKYINKHFVAVSSNKKAIINFGINNDNIFKIWNWVGGRYSLWSAIGLPIVLAIGYKNFKLLLHGAYKMDMHFLNSDIEKNLPILLALISIWYNNFFNCETELILPYDQYMHKFTTYLQQSHMESNGKCIDRNGNKLKYQTGSIIWGEIGTNAQHSFFQLLHQGTKLIPCDFIAPVISHNPLDDHHIKLLSNFFAQTQALAFGNMKKIIKKDKLQNYNSVIPFKNFEGNRPSNSILLKKISPFTLGALIALYEHKIFTQGIIFNIFSFDQWGVELGKKLSKSIESDIKNSYCIKNYDSSTNGLINIYKNWR